MTKAELQRQNKRYERAIRWALGEIGDFCERKDEDGAYWWRRELQMRAGLRWQWKKQKFVSREAFTANESSK